jgi:hypothetical protein
VSFIDKLKGVYVSDKLFAFALSPTSSKGERFLIQFFWSKEINDESKALTLREIAEQTGRNYSGIAREANNLVNMEILASDRNGYRDVRYYLPVDSLQKLTKHEVNDSISCREALEKSITVKGKKRLAE